MKTRLILGTVAFLFCLAILPNVLRAEPKKKPAPAVDLGAFVKEIMKIKMAGDRMELAIWLPFEFFVEANLSESDQTRQAVEKEMAFLDSYLTIIVLCSIDQADGSSLYSSEKEVRARAVLVLSDGAEIRPLDKVPPLVAATMAAMKTMMASEGDSGSANLHVLVFPSKDKQGKKIIDSKIKSKLKLQLKASGKFGNSDLTWHTPFDATTSVPPCRKCKESVSAKWSFCSWCGNKLAK